MKNSLYFLLALPLAIAQNNNDPYRDGLVSALQNANLNTLAAILQNLGNLSDALNDNRTHTVFAPSDSAFNTIGINSSSLPGADSQTTDLILYHILQGNANSTSVGNRTAPFRTLLGGNNTNSVKLPGNNSQVVILGPANNGRFQIIETQDNATVTGNTTYQNLVIDTIDHVLTIPGTLTSTVSTLGLSSLASAAAAINPSLPASLDNLTGITLFAPSNAAFDSFSNNLTQLNSTQIANVLENHILNGSVVYSTEISDGKKVTSGSGETLQFTKNSTGIFVQSANTTARVTRADILVKNGVIHLIDQVLVNTDSNPSAASSAASSASSAARTQTSSQTGPVSTGSGGSKSGAESIKGLRTSVWFLVGSIIGGAIVLL